MSQGDYTGAQQIDDEYADLFSISTEKKAHKIQLDSQRVKNIDPTINLATDMYADIISDFNQNIVN